MASTLVVLKNFNNCKWASTCRNLLVHTEIYLFTLRSTCSHWDLLVHTEIYLFTVKSTCLHWDLLVHSEIYLFTLRSTCSQWDLLVQFVEGVKLERKYYAASSLTLDITLIQNILQNLLPVCERVVKNSPLLCNCKLWTISLWCCFSRFHSQWGWINHFRCFGLTGNNRLISVAHCHILSSGKQLTSFTLVIHTSHQVDLMKILFYLMRTIHSIQ